MITVLLEMALDDNTYWQRSTEVIAVPGKGDWVAIFDPQRGGSPMPFVVATVEHRIDSHRREPPEIAVGFNRPGQNHPASDWREILLGLGFTQITPPHSR